MDVNVQAAESNSENSLKKSLMASTLVRAAALTAVLVPLANVVTETSTITCGFSSNSSPGACTEFGSGSGTGFGSGGVEATYSFDPDENGIVDYKVFLKFLDNVTGDFTVAVTDIATNDTLLDPKLADNFGNQNCLGIFPTNATFPCVEFLFEDSSGGTGWDGSWQATISWLFNTESLGIGGDFLHVLHERGDDCATPGAPCTPNGAGDYDTDVTVAGSYFSGFDPGISGKDDNFQRLTVTVPEPASIFLLATGLGGLLYRRRRANRRLGPSPPSSAS
jgi:PEP-CTERM motif-containing protein